MKADLPMPIFLQVALGGAVGATCRHFVSWIMSRHFGTHFPWGTLTVNVVGSFLMALATVVMIRRSEASLQHLAPFFMTGVLGGFTTFSAFSLEVFLMIEQGRLLAAMAYVGVSVLFGVLAFAGAMLLLRETATV